MATPTPVKVVTRAKHSGDLGTLVTTSIKLKPISYTESADQTQVQYMYPATERKITLVSYKKNPTIIHIQGLQADRFALEHLPAPVQQPTAQFAPAPATPVPARSEPSPTMPSPAPTVQFAPRPATPMLEQKSETTLTSPHTPLPFKIVLNAERGRDLFTPQPAAERSGKAQDPPQRQRSRSPHGRIAEPPIDLVGNGSFETPQQPPTAVLALQLSRLERFDPATLLTDRATWGPLPQTITTSLQQSPETCVPFPTTIQIDQTTGSMVLDQVYSIARQRLGELVPLDPTHSMDLWITEDTPISHYQGGQVIETNVDTILEDHRSSRTATIVWVVDIVIWDPAIEIAMGLQLQLDGMPTRMRRILWNEDIMTQIQTELGVSETLLTSSELWEVFKVTHQNHMQFPHFCSSHSALRFMLIDELNQRAENRAEHIHLRSVGDSDLVTTRDADGAPWPPYPVIRLQTRGRGGGKKTRGEGPMTMTPSAIQALQTLMQTLQTPTQPTQPEKPRSNGTPATKRDRKSQNKVHENRPPPTLGHRIQSPSEFRLYVAEGPVSDKMIETLANWLAEMKLAVTPIPGPGQKLLSLYWEAATVQLREDLEMIPSQPEYEPQRAAIQGALQMLQMVTYQFGTIMRQLDLHAAIYAMYRVNRRTSNSDMDTDSQGASIWKLVLRTNHDAVHVATVLTHVPWRLVFHVEGGKPALEAVPHYPAKPRRT